MNINCTSNHRRHDDGPFCNGFVPERSQLVAHHKYPRGAVLFDQGALLPCVWYVVDGAVKLTYMESQGRESIVELATTGEWIGTAAVVADQPAPISATTCSTTLLATCPSTTFKLMLRDDMQLSEQIHKVHAEQLCRGAARIGHLCSADSRGRLSAALYRFAVAGDLRRSSARAVRFDLPFHRWELAEFIGVTAEHLSRLFSEIEQEGLIRQEKGWIVVDDLEQLRRIA